MQNKENTSLSHFGRLRRKADRITAAAILSSTFNINAGCESDPAPKEDNTSELESKLAKVKEEAKQKEDTLKGQISTLESEKTTLEGEKTTKTTAINNLIGFVNALGGKTENPLPVGMAGLHSKTAIAENNCSEAHSVNGPLKTIYDELRLLNTNTAGQELSTLKSAIELFYQKNDIIAGYTSTSGNVQTLSAPTSGSTSATTVGGLLTHIEGLIASLKAEKTDAETAKTEYSAALSAIEGKLNITPATGTKVDQRATGCNTKITALENIYTKVLTDFNSDPANSAIQLSPATDEASCKTAVTARLKTQAGTPYDTVVNALNASSPGLNCGITATATGGSTTPTDDDYKTALTGYVGNLKGFYDKIPGANAADKNTYLDNLKGQLNLIVKLYEPTSAAAAVGTADLTTLESNTATNMTNTINKLVTDVTSSRLSLEYLYDTILAPAAGTEASTKPLGDIFKAIQLEGEGDTTASAPAKKSIENLKKSGVDFLTKVQTYVTDKTLLVKTGGGGGASYTNADIPMSELNTRLTYALGTGATGNDLLAEASYSKLFKELVPLTKNLTETKAGEIATDLRANAASGDVVWPDGTAAIDVTKTDKNGLRNNLLRTFVACRTLNAGSMPADNQPVYNELETYFNNCASADKILFIQKIIAKLNKVIN